MCWTSAEESSKELTTEGNTLRVTVGIEAAVDTERFLLRNKIRGM